MKKYLQIIIGIAFILSFAVNITVSATGEQAQSVKFSEDGKLNFRSRAISEEEIANLNNADLFTEPSDQELVQGHKIIKRYYYGYYWACAGLSFEEMCEKFNPVNKLGIFGYSYIILNDKLPQLYCTELDNNQKWKFEKLEQDENSIPQYLADLRNTNSIETFFDRECKLNDIICFDQSSSHAGTIVVLFTDQGNFVKYYEWPFSEAILFTEEEFRPYAIEYYDYYRFCNQKEQKVSCGAVSFPEFVEQKRQGTFVAPQIVKPSRTLEICLGAAGGVVLSAGVIIGIVVIRRKKRNA